MKRLIALIAVLALALAACGGGSSAAATVNGTDITIDDVDALFYEVTEEFTPEQLATYLGTLIQWTASEQAAEEDFDFVATPEAIDEKINAFLADYGYTGDRETFLQEQNVSEEGLAQLATQLLIEDAASEALADTVEQPTLEDAQAEIDANPMQYTQVCASHILVATVDEAKDVQDRLASGEDFADIAAEVSLDPGSGANGGSLGCTAPAQYVPEFAQATMDAEIGVVTDPVETQFGFHLIRVDDRTEATAEEVQSVMEDQALTDAVDAWLLDAITTADVTVDEQYGTWQTDPAPQLVPPVS
jgi:parvulin-like peptidyl-prolyl isomerase